MTEVFTKTKGKLRVPTLNQRSLKFPQTSTNNSTYYNSFRKSGMGQIDLHVVHIFSLIYHVISFYIISTTRKHEELQFYKLTKKC